MTNKIIGIVVVLLGLLFAFRLFISSTMLFLIIAAVLAVAAGTGSIGRTGYVLAGIFLILGLMGSTLRLALGAVAMLFKLAPLILVLVGIYMVAKAIRK